MGPGRARVVLDTNVLISALLWQGALKDIFVLVKKGRVKNCSSRDLLHELQRVLSYPKFAARLTLIGKTPKIVADEFLEIVDYYPTIDFPAAVIKDDPSDDAILACAIASQADFVVSGDQHLLRLKYFRNIPIVSPRKFLNLFSR